MEQRTPGEPHRAQAHQDRAVEPRDVREPRVGVDAVVVAGGDPVEQSLGRRRRVDDDVVGRAPGRRARGRRAGRTPLTAETALAAEEERRPGAKARLPGVHVDGVPLGDDERARALVVDAAHATAHPHRSRRRDRTGALDPLVAVHDALERDVTELGEREARARDPDAHRERRQHPQVDALGVLGHELELVPAATERKRVEHHVVGRPRFLPRPVLTPDDREVHRHGRNLGPLGDGGPSLDP